MQSQKHTVIQGRETAPAGAGFGSTLARTDRQAIERQARQNRAAIFGGWIGGGLAKLITSFRAAQRRRVAMAELSALDNRMLADIGISRGEISGVVSGASGFMPRAMGASTMSPSINDDLLGRVA